MATFTLKLNQVMEMSPNIGLDIYPIFDGAYREQLNQKIIDHFWNQEIGHETISMFTFAMRRKMNEIMPMYNQLYKSTQLKFDPMLTVDIATLGTSTGESESNSKSTGATAENSNSESDSLSKASSVSSNFPQSRLGGNKDYATSGQDDVSESSANAKANGTGTSNSTETGAIKQDAASDSSTKGFQGNRSALLNDYRSTFLNVDMLVIGDLEELFMMVWSTNQSFESGGMPYGP